ncbi:MAG TPA: hypothetical protein VJN63_02425 [Thermoplasmata archaeon]|nr:hypothetical protein [Thermoplasmata archaeon]
MVLDVGIDDSSGIVVLAWRSGEQGLILHVRGQGDEVRLKCRCGRCHWIVREQFEDDRVQLLISCHTCGVRGTYVMEGAVLPRP